MAWIEFHPDELIDNQKFQDFRAELRWSENEALGFLGLFWAKVLKLREAGDISGWKPDYIARLTGARAKPEQLMDALRQHHWIEDSDGRTLIHDWLTYAGPFLRGKYKTRNGDRLVEIWAIHGKSYGARDEKKDRSREGAGKELDRPPNRTEPNLTKPNRTEPLAPKDTGCGQPVGKSPEVPVEKSTETVRPSGGQGAMLLEAALFSKPWHFKGEHHLRKTGDLPPDYCRWALRTLTKLSAEERLALEILVKRDDDAKRRVR